MDLTTRCPECGAIFAASLEQLQLRKGYIRCVDCAHIFDGYDAVVPNAATPKASPTPPGVVRQRSVSAPDTAARPAGTAAPVFTISAATPAAPASRPDPVVPVASEVGSPQPEAVSRRADPAVSSSGSLYAATRSEPEFVASVHPVKAHAERLSTESLRAEPRLDRSHHAHPPLPDFLDDGRRSGSGVARLIWSLVFIVGAAIVVMLLAYAYRVQLASEVPALRPYLERMCVTLNCTVAYPQRIDHISIMDSSLQAVPVADKAKNDQSQMTLRIVLRNSFDKPQQWPTLALDLVDFAGVVVTRKTFTPADYLPEGSAGEPFAAKSETNIAIPVSVTGLKINGYQLSKFFPSERLK